MPETFERQTFWILCAFALTVIAQALCVPLSFLALGLAPGGAFQTLCGLMALSTLIPLGSDRSGKALISLAPGQSALALGASKRLLARSAPWLIVLGFLFSASAQRLISGWPPETSFFLPFLAFCAIGAFGAGHIGREALSAQGRAALVAQAQCASMLACSVGLWGAWHFHWGLWGFCAAWLLPQALNGIYCLWAAGFFKAPSAPEMPEWRAERLFFLALALLACASGPAEWIALSLGAGAREAAIYSAFSKITGSWSLLCLGFASAAWPRIRSAPWPQSRAMALSQSLRFGACGILLGAFFWFFGTGLFVWWIGEEARQWPLENLFRAVWIFLCARGLYDGLNSALSALFGARAGLLGALFYAFFALPALALGSARFGALGAILAGAFGALCCVIVFSIALVLKKPDTQAP